MQAAFIRAPVVERAGEDVEVLARWSGGIVAVRRGRAIGISFYPELTGDLTFHRALLS